MCAISGGAFIATCIVIPSAYMFHAIDASMKITRFHATDDGGSRFQEIELPVSQERVDPFGNILHQSNAFNSPSVRFVELPDTLDQSWHQAPARQIVFVLRGVVEVGTSDNEKRRWGAGSAFIPDDLSGKGHLTRVIEGPAMLAFIELPPGFDFDRWSS
jgi:quercetin dioxygenase-like cupin family protein